MVGIISWGCYIPRYRISVEEIAKVWGLDPQDIKRSLNITEKSLASIDEDTATIAVEASKNAIRNLDPKDIGAIYLGSESHPYAVKPTGTIVAEAIGMSNHYTTADLEFACKAGTAAIQIGMALVKSKMCKLVLAGGADTAQSASGDMLEYSAGAGGAVFIIGENASVDINETLSYTSDTPDFWRRASQPYPSHGGSFTGDPAYFRHVIEATKRLMEKAGTTPEDYDYAVFHQPNGKFPSRVAQKLGFTKEQINQGMIVRQIGNTYSGSALLGLCSVLDIALPGQRILLTSYGSGAGSDSFDMVVTDRISEHRPDRDVKYYLSSKVNVDYPTYLKFSGKLR